MDEKLDHRFVRWAQLDPRVVAVVKIGSQVRGAGGPTGADAFSDFDFQVVTSDVDAFGDPGIFIEAGVGRPIAHVIRAGRLGSARKLTSLFVDGELDVVLIPASLFEGVKKSGSIGALTTDPGVHAALRDLSAVIVGGYEILKGKELLAPLYDFVRKAIPVPRLDDVGVKECAEAFVCDYVSVLRKLGRGELIAAQRWIHHQLAEANFRLLHELRQRRGVASFPDARRIEGLVEEPWSERVRVDARLDRESLRAAADKSAATLRLLVAELEGAKWKWPELPL